MDPAAEFSDQWWSVLYNRTAESISVENCEVCPSLCLSNERGERSNGDVPTGYSHSMEDRDKLSVVNRWTVLPRDVIVAEYSSTLYRTTMYYCVLLFQRLWATRSS